VRVFGCDVAASKLGRSRILALVAVVFVVGLALWALGEGISPWLAGGIVLFGLIATIHPAPA
jgi:hypothetical protein